MSPPRRRHPVPLVLAVVLGFAIAVGAVVGLVVYDRSTAIDRSTPAVAVDQFLEAVMVNRDLARAGLFVCGGQRISDIINDLPSSDASIQASWGITSVQESDGTAEVLVRLRFTVVGQTAAAELTEQWSIGVVDERGWRVCSVQRRSSLNP